MKFHHFLVLPLELIAVVLIFVAWQLSGDKDQPFTDYWKEML